MGAELDLNDVASTSPLAMRELEWFRAVESAARALIADICDGCKHPPLEPCGVVRGCIAVKALREALDKEAT